jgi:purine nucleosidase
MGTLGTLASALVLPALAEYREHHDPAVHDVCAVASVAVPGVFGYTPAHVQVETTGQLTSGMTVTDFSGSEVHNAQVATSIDVDRFWDVVLGAYGCVAAALGQ